MHVLKSGPVLFQIKKTKEVGLNWNNSQCYMGNGYKVRSGEMNTVTMTRIAGMSLKA